MPRRRHADYAAHVEQLLSQAEDLPHGATRIELCEEAVRIADSHNDIPLAFRARDELTTAACMAGRPDLLIVAYTWCLAMFDRGEENSGISVFELLWKMKWVVTSVPSFPQVDSDRIFGMLDDMERRFRDSSGSIQPVVGKRRAVALLMGDMEEARRAHKQFSRMPRSFLSDCYACELDSLASYWIDVGKPKLGIRKGENLIAGGQSCSEVPDCTYADLLLPMLETGRAADAMIYHKKGYALIRKKSVEVRYWGDHMAYLALTGNDARAIKILESRLPEVEAGHDPLSTLGFLRSMLVAIDCIAERKEKAKLRLPTESPLVSPSGEYVLADLVKTIRCRVIELSDQFDQRNGNTYYQELTDKAMKLKKKAVRVPLK